MLSAIALIVQPIRLTIPLYEAVLSLLIMSIAIYLVRTLSEAAKLAGGVARMFRTAFALLAVGSFIAAVLYMVTYYFSAILLAEAETASMLWMSDLVASLSQGLAMTLIGVAYYAAPSLAAPALVFGLEMPQLARLFPLAASLWLLSAVWLRDKRLLSLPRVGSLLLVVANLVSVTPLLLDVNEVLVRSASSLFTALGFATFLYAKVRVTG